MGLFTYTLAGGGFILIGALESLISSTQITSSPPTTQQSSQRTKKIASSSSSSSSPITLVAVSLFCLFFILNSLISLFDAINSKNQTGLVIQLQVIAISSLFFLYSVLGLMTHLSNSIQLPSQILNLLCLFAFIEEFLLFYLQRKDPSGIENRYFDLLLVPIGVCVFSTILELKSPKSRFSRLARGIGLILQGTWLVQMGFSFYSDAMAHGCFLHEKSRGDYTIKCKGHPEYHRGRAIATLQFNCHLAFLVVVIIGVYSIVCKKSGIGGEFMRYRPLGAEMQQMETQGRFTLDSDDENEDGIKEVGNLAEQKAVVLVHESGINGYGSH
ncbi:plant viral-response family protein [Actinidia rufa]|uniref:Plant viral-response family protein n=1 Tax=Actinidia rufa TaxID=165716 RepID=A0A7J0E997_9ERIC|nr:plant viral-response family protein [Actinidia rufa]